MYQTRGGVKEGEPFAELEDTLLDLKNSLRPSISLER